jgi:hypothetical protein
MEHEQHGPQKAEPEAEAKHQVRIHIDRKPYESPNPTTGEALYILGTIPTDYILYREVHGDKEAEPIRKSNEKVHLKQDEHFYSEPDHKKDFTIIVNGRNKVVMQRHLSFADVVGLAFDNPPSGPNIIFTITYRNGPRENPEGTLVEGGTVKIKDRMIFNVTPTDKS